LVTKYIVNTACVEFGNNVVCDDAIINLEDPKCAYLDVR
jgi:hypothetical protein